MYHLILNTKSLKNNDILYFDDNLDEYFEILGPELFWEEFNKPFLDAAIERGDIIVMVTPLDDISLYKDNGELTGYGHEYYYLMEKGYVYDNGRMIPVNEVK